MLVLVIPLPKAWVNVLVNNNTEYNWKLCLMTIYNSILDSYFYNFVIFVKFFLICAQYKIAQKLSHLVICPINCQINKIISTTFSFFWCPQNSWGTRRRSTGESTYNNKLDTLDHPIWCALELIEVFDPHSGGSLPFGSAKYCVSFLLSQIDRNSFLFHPDDPRGNT